MFCKCLITTFYWICVPVFSLLVCVLVHVNNLEEIIKFGPEPGIKLEYEVIIGKIIVLNYSYTILCPN